MYLQTEKQSETGDIKVSLGSKQPHMHLIVGVNMTVAMFVGKFVLAIFVHFTDGILEYKR